ncbi:MAG: hypothetical protein ABL914_00680 [Novosphingobium sp.]|uniref:hypothetical protein n=1 Tax=Novosphingobium sp. TaxID=1874826 RepID=UPI0032BD334E
MIDPTSQYRFCTQHRCGKWYPSLTSAQQQAAAIGAGLLELRTGMFQPYRGTRLETR